MQRDDALFFRVLASTRRGASRWTFDHGNLGREFNLGQGTQLVARK